MSLQFFGEVKKPEKDFIKLCKSLVVSYANQRLEKTDGVRITEDDVYIVWLCKTIQNSKALVSTTLPDGMYYEITRNGDKGETYLDAYKKWENVTFRDDWAMTQCCCISPEEASKN